MIAPPADWIRVPGANLIVLRHPEGAGRLRYHPRLPPMSFDGVLRHIGAQDPPFVPRSIAGVVRLQTYEGEYAAWTTIAGDHHGAPAHKFVGAIIADEFVAAVEGLSLRAEHDAAIGHVTREVLYGARFGLGVRRRRFVFRPPADWHALAAGLETTFVPRDYPRHRAQIIVHPAEPSSDPPQLLHDGYLADEERRGFAPSGPVSVGAARSSRGLEGLRFTSSGTWRGQTRPATREVVILADDRYRYVIRLESEAEERLAGDRAVLEAIVDSAQGLPREGSRVAHDAQAAARLAESWTD